MALNANLNSIEPYATPKPKELKVKNIVKDTLYCKTCNIKFISNSLLEIHNKTTNHINKIKYMESSQKMEIKIPQTSAKTFICISCDVKCIKKNDWNRHILTTKHNRNIGNLKEVKNSAPNFICDCGKKYATNSGLWKHVKHCNKESLFNESETLHDISNNPFSAGEVSYLTNLVLEVVKNNTELQKHTNEIQKQNYELQKQNQEFQKQVLEICNTNKNSVINSNNNSNNNNKTFNLQFFLNEECKDAMNMSEFINSIQLKLSDLENFGKVGYVEGMSNIIIKKLNDTDMYKRPVHCSDAKRETLYVKEENKWEKEGPENSKMLKAVYSMNKKNYLMLNEWKDAHPNCLDGQTKQCDDYMKIMCKVMDGDKENINKVIKKVAKEVLINK